MRNTYALPHSRVLALSATLWAQNPELKSPLGREFHSLPDEKSAVAAAEKALAEHPTDVKLILKLAQAHASVWEDKEAVAACTRGLKIDPNNADLLLERGHRELPLAPIHRRPRRSEASNRDSIRSRPKLIIIWD